MLFKKNSGIFDRIGENSAKDGGMSKGWKSSTGSGLIFLSVNEYSREADEIKVFSSVKNTESVS